MNDFRTRETKMPVLFVGHGNPMYAIEKNEFASEWQKLGETIEEPEAVLCISAHWETESTYITSMEKPETIHDFYGFPKELFDVNYPAGGSPTLAEMARGIVKTIDVKPDYNRGLDHGCWAVMKHIYPNANIPVVQLSIARNNSPEWHYNLGKELRVLRNKGILIIGSGNIVHNLARADWRNINNLYDWAEEANNSIKYLISEDNHKELANYKSLGKPIELSIPTPEHYLPLLYILGMKEKDEQVKFFNDKIVMGSLSMTSMLIDK
jgi:4,5-DOPA dioxygenase extradiol